MFKNYKSVSHYNVNDISFTTGIQNNQLFFLSDSKLDTCLNRIPSVYLDNKMKKDVYFYSYGCSFTSYCCNMKSTLDSIKEINNMTYYYISQTLGEKEVPINLEQPFPKRVFIYSKENGVENLKEYHNEKELAWPYDRDIED